ncbi:MAG: hypothetical protein IID40_09650, partial [Planctomycetes bacterium]|nr:hypothetical protein [Planctomycetota bacterium]
MIEKAKSGDVTAAREVLDRTLGKPAGFVELGLLPRTEASGLRPVFCKASEVLADGNDDSGA